MDKDKENAEIIAGAIYTLAVIIIFIAIISNMVIANKLDKIYQTIPSRTSLWDVEHHLKSINDTLKTLKPLKKK